VRETRNVRWIPAADLQALADRTSAYAFGFVTDADFAARPGLEPVWGQWLDAAGAIDLSPGELRNIDHHPEGVLMSYPELLSPEEKLADAKRRLGIRDVVVLCGSMRFAAEMADAVVESVSANGAGR
jgi:hypothetical protein